mmetsp:Transcript_30539/g.46578  ORF Transcript_30539/g.46578 Transcript_30539/m.46578 type:complete len:298 (-) Transcript_30539:21-914(-)
MAPGFLIFIHGGDDRIKLRIPEEGIISGEALAKAILKKLSVIQNSDVVEIYDSESNAFVMLKGQSDVAKRFGTKLVCSMNYCTRNTSLPIEGRHFPYHQGMVVSGTFIEAHEQPNHLGAGTGLNVWDGAILLVKYLEQNQSLIQDKLVVELGSGCGLVGIASAALGATHVLLTDLPYTLDLLKQNVSRNPSFRDSVSCCVWDWNDKHPPSLNGSNVVMLADCVWVQELVPPLVKALKHIVSTCEEKGLLTVLVSYQQRGQTAHDLFWESMNEIFPKIERMDVLVNKPDKLNVFKLSL